MNLGLYAHQLRFQRNNQNLFNKLEVTLHPGQGLLIYGPNGCGKTSLLKILAGLLSADEGSIEWKGRNIHSSLGAYHQDLHFLGHHHGLKTNLSINENLAYSQTLAGSEKIDPEKITAALQKLQLLPHSETMAQRLSAGQKRRVALARLLASPKALWLLDEPLTNLDQGSSRRFCALLEEHLQNQGMAIIASHQTLALENKDLFQKISLSTASGEIDYV